MDNDRPAPSATRIAIGFACLFLLYQSAEGVGDRLLHSFPAQAGLMLACVVAAWPVSRWLGFRGLDAFALPLRARALAWLPPLLVLAFALKAAALQAGLALGIYAPDATSAIDRWRVGGGAADAAAVHLRAVDRRGHPHARLPLPRRRDPLAAGRRFRGGQQPALCR